MNDYGDLLDSFKYETVNDQCSCDCILCTLAVICITFMSYILIIHRGRSHTGEQVKTCRRQIFIPDKAWLPG